MALGQEICTCVVYQWELWPWTGDLYLCSVPVGVMALYQDLRVCVVYQYELWPFTRTYVFV